MPHGDKVPRGPEKASIDGPRRISIVASEDPRTTALVLDSNGALLVGPSWDVLSLLRTP